MSAQNAKKKRIGSRRRAANQNKTADADEPHITDSVSVVQPYIPEENIDLLNVLVNPDNSQSETPNPPSPDLIVNRRKLGSSRRSKGGERVKNSATETYNKPREEIEEKTRDDETPQTTRMSVAIQPQRQEELSRESEHDMSVTHDSSLYSAITPDYSSEVQSSTTNYPETDQESFILKSENLQVVQDENDENKIVSDSCQLVETVLGGTTKADTLQSEELEENADLVGTSKLTSLSVLSCATVDQQLITQSESRKIPEELVCVYSVTEEENKERDEDAELSEQNGNLECNYFVSDSHAESVVTQFSATPEIITDKTSPSENTKLEYIVEQRTFLSPNKELPKDEEQNEHFSLSEVSSEDAVNKMHEQEVNQTEMHEIDDSSESVTCDAAEKSEIISGNLIDQAEVSDPYQSELIVKSNEDSTTKQEDSNPDGGRDDHSTEEHNFGALEHTNEDYHLYDTQKLRIRGIERVDTALSQAYEDDGQEGDDRKSNAIQTVHQEKQGLFPEMEESNASLQTVQSETHSSVDSQPLQNDTGFDTFGNRRKLGSSRRNKGRQRFKEPVGESCHEHKEVVEGTKDNKAPETTELSVAIERRSQEELSQGSDHDVIMPATHDSSLHSNSMPNHSSEVQNPTTPNYPEVNLECLIPTSENLQEDYDDHDFKMEVSDKVTSEGMDESDTVQEVTGALSEDAVNKVHGQEVKPTHIDHPSESVTSDATENSETLETTHMLVTIEKTGHEEFIPKSEKVQEDRDERETDSEVDVSNQSVVAELEGMNKSNTPQSQEVRGAHHSEDAVNKVHEQEVNPTQMHEMEHFSESATHDATENPELISANMINQAEVSDTHRSELVVKSTDDSATRQEDSNPDGKQDDHPSKENNLEALEHKNDYHVDDIKSSAEQTHHEEKEETFSEMESESSLQSEANAPLDSQLLDTSVRIEEQNETGFHLMGNRRKLGSSRRNKGRQQVKECVAESSHEHKKEVLESTSYNEALERTQMLVTIERTSQDSEHDVIMSATRDSSLYSNIIPDSFEVLNPTVPTYPENELESLIHTSENLQEEHDQTETDFKVEAFDESVEVERTDKSETLQSQEVRGAHHSEDAVKQPHEQDNPTQIHEMHGIDVSSQSMLHDADDIDDSAPKHNDSNPSDKQDEHPTEENSFEVLEVTNEDYHVHDTRKLLVGSIITTDTSPGQAYEIEGRAENEIKPSAEQTVHREKEGLNESHLKSEDTESSFTPDISTEKNSLSKHTQAESSVEQAIFSSTKEELSTNEEQNEHFSLSEAKYAQYSGDAVNEVCEQEVKTTQVHEIDHSSENVTHEAIENSEMIPGKLIGQADDTDTYRSEFILKSTDDSSAKQEDLDFDDKQDEHPTKENTEALEHTDEDYHVCDTKEQQTSGIVNADPALGQVYEIKVQVEEDIKLNAEQTVHQERQGIFSKIEQGDSSLKSLQSESNVPLDSEPQQEDTKFNPIGNRKKLGSSRRNKRRPHAKESVAESQTNHRPTEVSGNTKENEPLETIKMSLTVETSALENSKETMLEGMDTRDTAQTEEVSDQIIENPHVGTLGSISELTTLNLHSSLTVSQQVIDQSNSTEMPDEELPSLSSVTAKENNKRNEDPEVLSMEENVEDNYLVSESHLKTEDIESSVTLKITTERQSPGEHTKHECSVEEAKCSSPKQELPASEEQNEHFNLSELKGAQHSEDFVNKVHEQEVNPTQMHEIDHPSESVTHDATENPELISANMINQVEVSDTQQSELVEKSTDHFATKQEDSNPDAKQDEDSTREDDFKVLEQTNEDNHVSDTMKQETSGIENEDTALGQEYEIEGQVEDDIKPSADQTEYKEKEGIFSKMEESESSLQTQQSDTNAPLDFQPQVDSVRTEEQTHTGFNPIGNRRKLGSSRRNKGRQQVKGSVAESSHEHKDVLESTTGNETLETTHMLVTIEKTGHEELSQEHEDDTIIPATLDSSLFSTILSDSSEVQNSNSTNYPEAVLESSIPKSEKVQEDHNERETDSEVDVSNQSVVAELEGMNKSNTPQSQEVRGAHHSEDAVNKVHEQEVNPTQMHEMEHFSESATHDATENPELISANMINQAEISDTHRSELVVKSADDFATKQEDSNPDAKLGDDSPKEVNFKALEQTNEDYHASDTMKQETSGIENEDTALGQEYEIEGQVEDDIKLSADQTEYKEKEGIFSEMEESESSLQTQQSDTHAPLDFQPQVDSVRTEEQIHTGFNPIANRRKLGSSRRNKGRQQVKGSVAESSHEHKDVLESTRGNETLETTHMLVTIEKTGHEEFIPKSEKVQEDHDERETDFKVDVSDQAVVAELEEMNKSNTPRSQEVRGAHHSEDSVNKVHEQEVNPTQMHEMEHFSESATHDATENPKLISANMINQAEVSDTQQSELVVKSTDHFAAKQEDSNPDAKQGDDSTKKDDFKALEQTNENYHVSDTMKQETSGIENAVGQVSEIEGQVEDDIKPSAEQTGYQEKQGLFPEMEEGDAPVQTRKSDMNAPLDSQPLQNNINFNPIGNRRKLGSSRRNKGRRHAKDPAESCHRPTEEVVGHTRDNELLEITKMSLTIETTGIETCDTAQTEVSDQVKENAHVGTFDGISELTTSLHSSLTADHQIIDQSNSTAMPEQELPNVYSVRARESNERDKDTELLSKDGNLQDDNFDLESSMTPEETREKSSPAEHTDIECSGEQAAFTSPREELSSNEEQKEPVNLSQVRGFLHSEDGLNEVYEEAVKPTQTEEIHQIDKLTFVEQGESSLQTLQSEMNAPLDSQPLDTSVTKEEKNRQGFNPTGNRRKLGSSRRNKGRQHVKDSVTETYHKPEEEFVENTRGDEVLETTNRSLATETMKQEELKMQTDLDLKPTLKTRKKRSTINDKEETENVPEEDGNTDITSIPGKDDSIKFNKDIDKEENNLLKEPENFSHLTGHDTVKMDLIQSPEDGSDIQTNVYHDDKATTKSVVSELLAQEDAHEVQSTDTLSCDKDSLRQETNMQQTNDAIETVDVKIKDYDTGAECSMNVQVFGQDEAGEKSEDPSKKDHDAQEMDTSVEITNAEPESGTSTAVIQEKNDLDDSENLSEKSKQKKRKMGSTRRIKLKRIPEEGKDNEDEMKESDFNMEGDMNKIDKMEAVEELPMTVTAEVLHNENVKSSDLLSIQSHLTSDIGDLTAPLPGQPASHNEDVVHSVKFVQVTDMGDREKNINVEPSQVDITYVQNDEDRPENANIIQDQVLKSAEASVVAVADLEIVKSIPRGGAVEEQKDAQACTQEATYMNEEAHSKNLEMKNASPNLNSPNRRRKMGSCRRSLGSRRKEEDLHQKQQVDNEATEAATNVGDVKTASFLSIKEKEEPQPHTEDKDGDAEQRREKVFETVEYRHTGESHFNPPSHQTFEESPASQGQLVKMEPQLTPSYVPPMPSTSPKHDVMSEFAGGRRRKMGSHRKSRVHQNDENRTTGKDLITDTQDGRDVRSVTEENAIKETEEESLGLDRRSEVDEGDKKPSSNVSTSNAGELPKPVSAKTPEQVTPVQQPNVEIHLGKESQKMLSLAGSSGGSSLTSKRYNVMMVGDSSVGKTSFIKRAQSGKFSLDLPASVGLDSCMWTVVVDGKPVVLQLWDTAGQERFHSITRQIFHKAQAFLLMYDITSSKSFAAVSYWANCIQEGAPENVTILLIGNKSDCAKRQVKTQEGEILAKEYNCEFMECSAATGENVIQSLETVARILSQKVDTREETMVLHKEPQQKKSSGCC